jgi:hypothetical protein
MILIGGNLNALNIDGSHFHIGNDMKLMSTLIVILMMTAQVETNMSGKFISESIRVKVSS